VIFLDEPTSGLSPDLDLEMMELLKELSKKGRTIVVVTHAMENLDKCDKIAFLGCGGRLVFYGKQAEVFRYFNKKSYSRIFAALSDETVCKTFEARYKNSEYFKELSASFEKLYNSERPKDELAEESDEEI
ncbi:MAG: maltooligosyl trehalose synthase, partial [Bacillota bacterium]